MPRPLLDWLVLPDMISKAGRGSCQVVAAVLGREWLDGVRCAWGDRLRQIVVAMASIAFVTPNGAVPCPAWRTQAPTEAEALSSRCCCHSEAPDSDGTGTCRLTMENSGPEERDRHGCSDGCDRGCLAPCCLGKPVCQTTRLMNFGLRLDDSGLAFDLQPSRSSSLALDGLLRPPRC